MSSTSSSKPLGLNHVVINVRNMEESHRFWTEVVGLVPVGELHGRPAGAPRRGTMRFYSGERDGRMHHHDIALVEAPGLPPPSDAPTAIGHIAIAFPDREAWLAHLTYLQDRGVGFDRRVEHGMTHSVYIRDPNGYSVELLYELPRSVWEGDIDAALNHYIALPTQGAEALSDSTDVPVFTR
ncbi:MAG: VOC family protein [Acetobacteraceae bacterium]|nr:VOC family protein [Acetobacteraceae bacterium]